MFAIVKCAQGVITVPLSRALLDIDPFMYQSPVQRSDIHYSANMFMSCC